MRTGAPTTRWLFAMAIVSLSAAIFQISFIRIISYVFPFQMIFAVSLVTGIAIFFSGIGALIASRAERFPLFAVLTAICAPLSLYGVSLFTTRSMSDFSSFGVAVAIGAFPFTFYGILTGICYRSVHRISPSLTGPLVAISATSFFIGLTGAAFLTGTLGVTTLALIAALSFGALFFSPLTGGLLVLLLVVFCAIGDVESHLFPLVARKPALWGKFGTTPRVVGGGWSPYARVDLVDIGEGRLAGLYNGVQYWMTGGPEHDVPFRRTLYGAVEGTVLVIGTGGGHGLLSLTKASRIEAVELDPTVIGLLKGPLSRYNRNVYNTIAVAHAGDGRSYLETSRGNYDAIILEAAEVGLSNYHRSFISLENYLYTTEAMAVAFKKLKPDGILIVIHTDRHVPRERFIKAFPPHVSFRTFQATSIVPSSAGIRFTTDITIASTSPQTLERWRSVVIDAAPDIVEQTKQMLESDRFKAATPIGDDRPTLYLERYSQLAPFIVAATILFLIAFVLAFWGREQNLGFFFFALGIAFMLTELLIINLLRAALNGYVETSAVALGFHTLGTAAGAVFSLRAPLRTVRLLLVPAFLLFFSLLSWFPFGSPWVIKVFLMALAILPFSFLTGTLFPRGFFAAPTATVPRYYAVDTIASGGAFLLFYVVAALTGFRMAALLPLVAYGIAVGLIARKNS